MPRTRYLTKRRRVYAAIVAEGVRDRERVVQAAERVLRETQATREIIERLT